MWTEALKDFGIAFLAGWFLWSALTCTILDLPSAIVWRFSRSRISMTTKRLLAIGGFLLVISCTLAVRSSQELLYMKYTEPLNAPLELDLGEA